jgi:hypothetical protein
MAEFANFMIKLDNFMVEFANFIIRNESFKMQFANAIEENMNSTTGKHEVQRRKCSG